MSIQVGSTTDTKEQVTAAQGDAKAKPDVVAATEEAVAEESKSASSEKTDETLEASDASTENETESEEKSDEGKSKKKGGVQKRINKLRAKTSAAEAKAEALSQEVNFLREQVAKGKNPEPQTATALRATDEKPNKDEFETHDDYIEALTDWKVDQKDKAKDVKTRETAIKTEVQKQVDVLGEKIKEFKKTHDDWDETIESIEDIPISLTVQEVILGSEDSALLMYELCKNRDEYERICKLPAIAAARELGKFEAKLLKAATSENTVEAKVTKAPKPMNPVGGKGSGSGKKSMDDPNLSQHEYEKMREEQLARARAA